MLGMLKRVYMIRSLQTRYNNEANNASILIMKVTE
ncbi:hypothetical protein SAMN04515679_2084 [Pelosinus fermentans]|uniref:Uncharacterized protein n=1 Tax=Pelosinus fermentans B4 TaxID=1149862 RepID=I9LA94_9FIRM|nr:hypothetical protein FB4_4582 [Pelosinus fermentans B4]EIW22975.1 hypothetical protein FA11_4416 [Pelosinus fermentans A11]OAM93984.1 hypothetical protein FR7_02001 [Pelosinus fermentans DSM 17108]SDQ96297.1 hypothetical protein SAMN04515679_2084 [Pelosinus fermentans]